MNAIGLMITLYSLKKGFWEITKVIPYSYVLFTAP